MVRLGCGSGEEDHRGKGPCAPVMSRLHTFTIIMAAEPWLRCAYRVSPLSGDFPLSCHEKKSVGTAHTDGGGGDTAPFR